MEKVLIEKVCSTRAFYTFTEKNHKKEKLVVEITEMDADNTYKNSLPNLWKKHGYTNKLYNSYLCVSCYCYNEEGYCFERYNPTIELSEDKKRNVINFDWLLEVSEENKEKLLKEIYRRFLEG